MTNEIIRTDENEYIYRNYTISGNANISYVCVSPYGKFSPKSYTTIDEAIAAIDVDIAYIEDNKNADKLYTVVWWGKRKRLTKDFVRKESAIKFMVKLANENQDRYLGLRYIEYSYDESADDYVITFDTLSNQ